MKMYFKFFFFLLFIGLLGESSLIADANIAGTVTSFSTGLPISGATVVLTSNRGQTVGTTTTNSSGQYAFNNISPRKYNVTASASGYQTQSIGAKPNNNTTLTVNFGLLSNSGAISGNITNADNLANISGATIQAFRSGVLSGTATSDASGNYIINGLPPGSYVVTAVATNYQSGTAGAIVTSNTTTNLNFSLQPNPGNVAGIVLDNNGTPLAGVLVEANINDIPISSTLTDPSGNYILSNLAPGTYIMQAHAANYSVGIVGAIIVSNQTTTANFSLVANPGAVAGTVTDANGIPLPGVVVEANLNDIPVLTALTDNSGHYIIENLSPGS